MRLALAAGGALLLALLTWLLLSGINTNASAYAETQRALDDFALAEASIGRDVLQARAGLLGNYDVLAEAEEAMESAASRIRLHVEAENLDPKPVEALVAAVGQYEDLIERFKTGNSLLQNSLSYVGQLSTDPAFGALGDQFAPSATALAAAVLRLAGDSSPESAKSLQQHINRFEAQAPTGGLEGEAAHALLAHARLLSDLLPEVDQTLRALVAAPSRQPFEETRELLARSQAAFEVTAQRFRVLLYVVSLGLLVIALRLGQRLWTRTLRIRRLVDANIIGIFIWDFDGRIIEANDAFLHMVGYDHEDIVSGRMRWTDLTPPDWRDRDARLIQEHKMTGSLQPFEKEYFRKDGSRVPVLIGVATFEEAGNQGVAFVLDLTERKRAEVVGQRLAAIVDSSEDAVVSKDLNGTIESWNGGAERLFGYQASEVIGKSILIIIPPDRHDEELGILERIRRGERIRSYETVRMRKDGGLLDISLAVSPLRDAAGRIIGASKIARDITERKRAEERLRVQHAVAQILAEAATIEEATPRILRAMGECLGWDVGALWRVDREAEALRCVELWHKASIEVPEFERVSREYTFVAGLGLPGRVWSSLEPKYIPDVVPDENFPRASIAEREGLHAAFGFPILLGGEVLGVIEFFSREIRQPDQELLNMLATISSQIAQFIERKRAEEALREVQAELGRVARLTTMGQLTASIAHEVKQPIGASVNNALAAMRFLDSRPPDLGEVRQALADIVKAGSLASDVIDRIRDLIKRAPPRKDRLEINGAIRDVIELTRGEAVKNGVSVRTELADALPLIEGDRVELQQVILNLIMNAIEAMSGTSDGSRELIISTGKAESGGALVAVRDSGPGLAPATLEHIFDAFYTTKPNGMGMGLSISHSIIKAHGGRLWAEANVPRGAVFQFTLPGADREFTNFSRTAPTESARRHRIRRCSSTGLRR